ncbi:hypothetical protein [Curtobacterium sp. B18]|uniref:hypothetical protein n=1 Tax=Curtobacterium sp. B18 TaxID=95614 RepID=UPI00034C1EEF|nr:hypothetical protein [Curtobacterium sp. B18]
MTPARPLDDARLAAGFLTPDDVAALAPDVLVLDPSSVLIGRSVRIEPGVVLYPGTVLEGRGTGTVVVRSGARLGPGPVTVVAHGADVEIGPAELGPGSVTVVATDAADVVIGPGARLSGGCLVEGPATIGAGAQVIGPVSIRDVVLAAAPTGAPPTGTDAAPCPRFRQDLGVRLGAGDVVVGRTEVSGVERQRGHHPDAPRR